MKPNYLLFALLMGISFLGYSQTSFLSDMIPGFSAKKKETIGKPFGEFTATGDSAITQQLFSGRVVFVNFWFEACKPCVAEFDGLNALYKQTKNNKDFLFVTFTFEPVEKINELKEKHKLNYPIYHLDEESCLRLNRGAGYPTNIVISKAGNVIYYSAGGFSEKDAARDYLLTEVYSEIRRALHQ